MYQNRTSKFEDYTCLALLLIFTTIFGYSAWVSWSFGAADNVFIVQLADNIANRGLPYSQISLAIKDMFDQILGQTWEVFCALDLSFSEAKEFNYFKWHTYVFLYILAPINKLFGTRNVLPFLTAFSFCSILFCSYRFLRQYSISSLIAGIFVFLVMLHPAWHQSLAGQLYCDRFYLLLGFPFLSLLADEKSSSWKILILGLIIASISDRFGAIIGAQVLYFAFLPLLSFKAIRWNYVGMGLLFTSISFLILNFYSEYDANKSFSSTLTISSFLLNLNDPVFKEKLISFIAINSIGLGSLTIFAPKYLPLLLCLMYPNIVGTLGGAEKIGFLTHYHTAYFPLLVFVSALGLCNLNNIANSIFAKYKNTSISLLLLAISLSCIYVTNQRLDGYFTKKAQDSFYFYSLRGIVSATNGHMQNHENEVLKVHKYLNPKDRIVTTEFALPILGLQHDVAIVPLGLKNADYAFLPIAEEIDGKPTKFSGSVSYSGPEDTRLQNECINRHLVDLGYDIKNTKKFGSWGLIKRSQNVSITGQDMVSKIEQ